MLMLFVASLLAVPFPASVSSIASAVYIRSATDSRLGGLGWHSSALRAYSPDELLSLAQAVPGAAGYRWESRVIGSALYLTGVPL